MKFINEILKLQHKSFNLINAKDILPHPTTVSRSLGIRAESVRQELSAELREAFNRGIVSFTSDMWTDDLKQRSFLSITSHWIDEWRLNNRLLCVAEFDIMLRKTGSNIKQSIESVFHNYGLSDQDIKNSIFTTDQGSNMILALKNDVRLDCFAHILNTILRNAINNDQCPPAIFQMINSSKDLVRYFKRSSLHNLLNISLKQACSTRWNSIYLMKPILEQYENIEYILFEHKRSEVIRISNIDRHLLKELIDFLEIFYNATNEIEGDLEPTLHLVLPWMKKIKQYCNEGISETFDITTLKNNCLYIIDEKFKPHLYHKIAVFLNPRQKSMKVLSEEDQTIVLEEVKRYITEIHGNDLSILIESETVQNKRSRIDTIREYDDECIYSTETEEISRYRYLQINPLACVSVLSWWKENAMSFPKLSKLAEQVFSIMPTSAPS